MSNVSFNTLWKRKIFENEWLVLNSDESGRGGIETGALIVWSLTSRWTVIHDAGRSFDQVWSVIQLKLDVSIKPFGPSGLIQMDNPLSWSKTSTQRLSLTVPHMIVHFGRDSVAFDKTRYYWAQKTPTMICFEIWLGLGRKFLKILDPTQTDPRNPVSGWVKIS